MQFIMPIRLVILLMWILTTWIHVAIGAAVANSKAATKSIDFTREIRPILSDNCFSCHGPDENQRKGKLRLDLPEELLKAGKSGKHAVIPGKPEESELIRRLVTKDLDDLMPPEKSNKKLNQSQIDLLQRWIKEGAKSEVHWAFKAPKRPSLPQNKSDRWAFNEIDSFVSKTLQDHQLKASKQADKSTLLRRVTFDTTGLPPTPDEIDAFMSDKSNNAYDKVVDRLLNSPRFGENMARYWLDAVRYADTHGYHIDSERSMWKYRDWIIEAFNQNKAFDAFTTEQLAGDLLEKPTIDQKIASGYVRANMTTGEGGAIEEEYVAKYTFDRVETTGTIYLGMTLVCARCHTHKYDPITHKEYYGLYSFFNNLNEAVMDGNAPNPEPVVKVPSPEQAKRLQELKSHIGDAEKRINEAVPALDQPQTQWEKDWQSRLLAAWSVSIPTKAVSTATNGAVLNIEPNGTINTKGDKLENDTFEITLPSPKTTVSGLRIALLPALDGVSPSLGRKPGTPVAISEIEADLVATTGEKKKTKISFAHTYSDVHLDDKHAGLLIDGKLDTAWKASGGESIQQPSINLTFSEPIAPSATEEIHLRLRFEGFKDVEQPARFQFALATAEPLTSAFTPPKMSYWRMLGPLPSNDAKTSFDSTLAPETEFQPDKGYPGVKEDVKWHDRKDIPDGKSILLVQDLHGIHGVRFLRRTFQTTSARKINVQVRADGLFKVWVNGQLAGFRDREEKSGEGPLKLSLDFQQGENVILVKVVTIQGAAHFTFTPDPESKDTLTPPVAVVLASSNSPTSKSKNVLRDYYRRQFSPEFKTHFQNLALWKDEENVIDRAVPRTMVAKEMDKPRDTFLLTRGEYDKKADKVTAGVPSFLNPLPSGAPTNRLGLAKWLLDPAHPLTARVTVNRFWQQLFGTGLVKTSDDFGVQGDAPSHPELLDWLACQFRDGGTVNVVSGSSKQHRHVTPWNVKEVVRLMVTSSTYRQSSRIPQELLAKDPENRLLARGPRFRMDGEVVRDSALFVSDLLADTIGGRSVKPYEPPGLWEAVSFNNSQKYIPETGEAQYRRSLYTFWKRQSPPPNMLIFDAPTREYCTVRRSRSNTPLQALVTLNDPHFVESSRALADRILKSKITSTKNRLRFGFKVVTSREPSASELKLLETAYQQQLVEFSVDPESAEKLLKVGDYKSSVSLPKPEHAAWTTLAGLLLNLDEALTKN